MTTVTVAIVQFNTGRVLETVLADAGTIPVMATALSAHLAWERTLLGLVKPRDLPAPGQEADAGVLADPDSLYALVEGRDFPMGNIPARGWQWNNTRNAAEAVFAEYVEPEAPSSLSQAIAELEAEFLEKIAQLKELNG